MRFLDKMERKFGRYAIRNLPLIMIVLLVAGYTLSALFPSAANYYAFIPPYIMRGEIWRLIITGLRVPLPLHGAIFFLTSISSAAFSSPTSG